MRLSTTAQNTIAQIASSGDQVALSSITLAEIVYLSKKGRISPLTLEQLLASVDTTDALLVEVPFTRQIAEALPLVNRSQVPDLPDRIIAATALYLGVPVISRDSKIKLSSVNTIW
ncbi:type II toxin-antitoxin system VapC family toxin [Nostoc sp.]|uniref:type II toxin-antitoxin system VapC family toxin n=1 Tax=Nostoc sp. TaxID=1180 RepID=UPI002FFCED13